MREWIYKHQKGISYVIISLIFIVIMLFGIPFKVEINSVQDFKVYYEINSYTANNVLNREGKFYTKIKAKKFHKDFLDSVCKIKVSYSGSVNKEEASVFSEEEFELHANELESEGVILENFSASYFDLDSASYEFDCEIKTKVISKIVSIFQK